jgi:hypothetical protein
MAYIDPNTGGMLFQIAAALFAGFTASVLLFSRQIRAAIARGRRFLRERGRSEEENRPLEDRNARETGLDPES